VELNKTPFSLNHGCTQIREEDDDINLNITFCRVGDANICEQDFIACELALQCSYDLPIGFRDSFPHAKDSSQMTRICTRYYNG